MYFYLYILKIFVSKKGGGEMSVYFLEKLMGYGYVLGFCFVFRFKR